MPLPLAYLTYYPDLKRLKRAAPPAHWGYAWVRRVRYAVSHYVNSPWRDSKGEQRPSDGFRRTNEATNSGLKYSKEPPVVRERWKYLMRPEDISRRPKKREEKQQVMPVRVHYQARCKPRQKSRIP